MSTGRTFPTSVAAPVLLESLKITGRVRPLQVIHRFQALLGGGDKGVRTSVVEFSHGTSGAPGVAARSGRAAGERDGGLADRENDRRIQAGDQCALTELFEQSRVVKTCTL